MLRIRLCTDRKQNTNQLLREICDKAGHGVANQVLLVPEQFSHITERKLCSIGGDSISRYAEVLGFSRLAVRVFTEVGGCAETETDDAGKLLIMTLAVEQVRSQLKIYGNCTTRPEFLLSILETLEEFRSFCVNAQQLRDATEKFSGTLAVKTEEFALLMESYEAVCANLGQNPETRLTRLLHALEESDFAENRIFYFDGFTDFNGVEKEIIAQLLNKGASVTVNLTCDGIERGGQQFAVARETAKSLQQLALRQQLRAEVQTVQPEETASAFYFLRKHLFYGGEAAYSLPQQNIRLIAAPDSVGECRIAAGQMLELVSHGMRWREMAIACADYETYQPILLSVFRRAGIPAYFGGDSDILHQNVVYMLLSALEAATQGMEQAPVMAYIKSGFAPITTTQADCLENYVLLWQIEGTLWEQEWTMTPNGFHALHGGDTQTLLAALNQSRKAAINPLLNLRNELKAAKNTAQMVTALSDFMTRIDLENRLSTLAQACFDNAQLQKAQEYAQVYEIFCRLLEQVYGVLGESMRSPEDFYRILRVALSRYSVGTIPASLDCVSVGSLMTMRQSDCKILFLLGAREGSFPTEQSNAGLLTDNERKELMRVGIGVLPTCAGKIDRELAAIDSVLSAPQSVLYLGAPEDEQSYYLRRATALFPRAERITDEAALISRSTQDYLAYLIRQGRSLEEIPPNLREQVERLQQPYQKGILSTEAVRALYGEEIHLSSTGIDVLVKCRFSYYLQYGLKAEDRKPAEMDKGLFGTFVHAVLEKTVRQVRSEGGFTKVSLERTQEIAKEHINAYMQEELADLLRSEREKYLFSRNFAEVAEIVERLYQELSQSKFIPKWLELKFGMGDGLPLIQVDGEKTTVYLKGIVDRVDVFENDDKTYIRVVDYKTEGKKIDFSKLYAGKDLQLFLYLFALCREGEQLLQKPLTPAGALYYPAKIVSVTDNTGKKKDSEALNTQRKKQLQDGILLNDYTVLQAMEPCEAKTPTFLPYKYDKKGEREGKLVDAQAWQLIEKDAFAVVAELGDVLYSGDISVNPFYMGDYHSSCEFCPYQSLCTEKQYRYFEEIGNITEYLNRIDERRTQA